MSMTITFYNQSSPTNKITKTLGTALGSCTINNIHDINVVDPVFIIKSDALSGSLENLAKANYVVAGAPFNRDYFITGVDFSTAKTAVVYCHCDVLSTYASSLGTLNFTRGAGDINEMDDVSYPISDYMIQQHYKFGNWTDIFSADGSGRRYILRTICAPTAVPSIIELTQDGQVFWDFGHTYIRESDNAQMYVCYQFNSPATPKTFAPLYVPRQDIQGIISVNDGDYVSLNGSVWQWNSKEAAMEYNKD